MQKGHTKQWERTTLENKISEMFWGFVQHCPYSYRDKEQFLVFCIFLQVQIDPFQNKAGKKTTDKVNWPQIPTSLLQADTPNLSCRQHIAGSHRLIAVPPVASHCLLWQAAATSNVTLDIDWLLTCRLLHITVLRTRALPLAGMVPHVWLPRTMQRGQTTETSTAHENT